eukprot:979433-Pyramimonas_sp.AAC.1
MLLKRRPGPELLESTKTAANAKRAGWRQRARDHSVDGAAALFAAARPRAPWHSTERFDEG